MSAMESTNLVYEPSSNFFITLAFNSLAINTLIESLF